MVNRNNLEEYKTIVQNIINKYFPEDKRFSVKDYNKEQLWYVCRLLLEKDNKKRKEIWKEIAEKLRIAKYEYEKKYYEIVKNKELFDNYNNSIEDIDDLANDIEVENEIDTSLLKL